MTGVAVVATMMTVVATVMAVVATVVTVMTVVATMMTVVTARASDRAKLPCLVLPAGGVPGPHRGACFGGLARHVQRLCERLVHPGPGPAVLGGRQPTAALGRGGLASRAALQAGALAVS